MRTLIVILLSCAPLLGADSNIQVISRAVTNEPIEIISTTDVFTRGGQTNLVRLTQTKGGVVIGQSHKFYHGAMAIGDYVAVPADSGFTIGPGWREPARQAIAGLTIEAGSPYSAALVFWPSNQIHCFSISAKDGVLLDRFNYTNGVFSPVESSVIEELNGISLRARGKAVHSEAPR
jgi:hypothetical protein